MEKLFIDIQDHAYLLGQFLNELSHKNSRHDFLTASTWINLVSSIHTVDVQFGHRDQGFGWCRQADDFFSHQSQLYKSYVRHLTIFTYMWGGTENLLKASGLAIKSHKKSRSQLQSLSASARSVGHFDGFAKYFIGKLGHILESGEMRPITRDLFSGDVANSVFQAISKTRNHIFHGSLPLPFVSWEDKEIEESKIIELATRAALLLCQAVVCGNVDLSAEDPEQYFSPDDYPEGLSVKEWVEQLHLKVEPAN